MPTVRLEDKGSIAKAKVQILHQEPLILALPDNIDLTVSWDNFSCEFNEEQSIHYDCNGARLLAALANRTHIQDLNTLSDACQRSGLRVDADLEKHRLIFHD
jgi:hypothetical protein